MPNRNNTRAPDALSLWVVDHIVMGLFNDSLRQAAESPEKLGVAIRSVVARHRRLAIDELWFAAVSRCAEKRIELPLEIPPGDHADV